MNKKEVIRVVKKAIKANDLKSSHHNLNKLLKILDDKTALAIHEKLWAQETMTPSILIEPFFKMVYKTKV